jgi:anaerobic nitric oxide reductase transcription regulator
VINDVLLLAGHFLELNRARLGLRGIRLSAAAEQALLSVCLARECA